MLVVVVVLGLLMVGLTQGVRAGFALWGAQKRRVGETAELDAAQRTLRTLLSGIATAASGGAGSDAAAGGQFKGETNQLAFVGNLPTGLGITRRADIEIERRGKRVVLRWTPRRHAISTGPPPEPIETELIGGVERLDFAYWAAPAADQPAAWLASWGGPAPSQLVRVRMGFAKGDRRRWPDLIVAPEP